MINIFKIEVSINGRDHIVKVIDTDIMVKNKKEMEATKKFFVDKFSGEDELNAPAYVYMHYREGI